MEIRASAQLGPPVKEGGDEDRPVIGAVPKFANGGVGEMERHDVLGLLTVLLERRGATEVLGHEVLGHDAEVPAHDLHGHGSARFVRLEDGVGIVHDDLTLLDEGAQRVHVGEQSGLSLLDIPNVLVHSGIDTFFQQCPGYSVPLVAIAHDKRGDLDLVGGELTVVGEFLAIDGCIHVEGDGVVIRHPSTSVDGHGEVTEVAGAVVDGIGTQRNVVVELGDDGVVLGVGFGVVDVEDALRSGGYV